MKRYIYSRIQYGFLDNVNQIDAISIVNDARKMKLSDIPITAATGDYYEDYDKFTIEELMDLDTSELRQIDSFYALDNLLTAINEYGLDYKMTANQKTKLHNYYKNNDLSKFGLTEEDKYKIIELIQACKHVTGPDYRPGQPEKNFALIHNLNMTQDDYLAILKDLTAEECIGAVKSADTRRLGSLLYEFIHYPKGYVLKYSKQRIEDPIKIYIKILPDFENDYNIAIVSFHDPLD